MWMREEVITALYTALRALATAEGLTIDDPGRRMAPDTAEFLRPAIPSMGGAWYRQVDEHGSGLFMIDIFVRPQASGNAYRMQEIADILSEEFDSSDHDLAGGNMCRLKEGVLTDFGKDPQAPEYFHGQIRWEFFIVP